MALILDGKKLSAQIRAKLRADLEEKVAGGGVTPFMTAMQVGDFLPSTVYIRAKQKACEELGIGFRHLKLPENTTQDELLEAVNEINNDDSVHGLLVQSPLPNHLNEIEVQRMVAPAKDVDCFHPENVGLLYIGQHRFHPATAGGIVEMLMSYGIDPSGQHAVIIGRSVIVGRPLTIMLMLKQQGGNATVTVCHSRTQNLKEICRQADILIPAIGQPELIKADWIKDGAVVVDVGINRVPDASKKRGYRLVGDADFEAVEPKCSAIAPVPGGVGPMTVAILMKNVMRAAGYSV